MMSIGRLTKRLSPRCSPAPTFTANLFAHGADRRDPAFESGAGPDRVPGAGAENIELSTKLGQIENMDVLRRKSWFRHIFGDQIDRPRRLFRLAFRDLVVETTLRLRARAIFNVILRKWTSSLSFAKWLRDYELRCASNRRQIEFHRVPNDLALSEFRPRRMLLVGSCLSERLAYHFRNAANGCPCDFILANNLSELPPSPPCPFADYDFQLVQLPLRSLLPEAEFFLVPYSDIAAHERLFENIKSRLQHQLNRAMKWNSEHGVLTFVANFFVPQQNPLGRLLPSHDLRNPVYLIEQINALLARELEQYSNAFLINADQIAATFGKAYIQDDAVELLSHNSGFPEEYFNLAADLREQLLPLSELFEIKFARFADAVWLEMCAMLRTIRQIDQVKLVVVDLDNTLWQGVAAEGLEASFGSEVEGWPIGVIEALHFIKRRGVLLAVVSKNDEGRIRELWDQIMLGRLNLDSDFVAHRINWKPKVQNLSEILQELNLLPKSVVFVDDNPVERSSVESAFAGIRTLGANPYLVRQILLWAPETQVATITAESSTRTEMVHAQLKREEVRSRLSAEEFLATLNVKIRLSRMPSAADSKISRTLELINKTNQFNTTGRRWTLESCAKAISENSHFFVFEVQDRFTNYGLVGVAILQENRIEQFVMSCRVFGLEVEKAVIAELSQRMQGEPIIGRLKQTEANLPARDLYARCGFSENGDDWIRPPGKHIEMPSHVELKTDARDYLAFERAAQRSFVEP
jgi:FkbH-like protein